MQKAVVSVSAGSSPSLTDSAGRCAIRNRGVQFDIVLSGKPRIVQGWGGRFEPRQLNHFGNRNA